nr:hypothetical protein [Tanacetum cinerariifolium]
MAEHAVFQKPLYLHPSDDPSSLTVYEKLIGAQNYRAWRTAIEIGLSTKRKLGCSVGEYYTKMKCVWEELDNLNTLLVIARITPEITTFLNVLNKQKEEQRLFQFLNGLEDKYSHQRSQILMINPLPNVKNACSLIQQEESQRMMFGSVLNIEATTLYSKGADEEIDHQFVVGIACLNTQIDLLELLEDWIYDTGASDHMTLLDESIYDPYQLKIKPQINLPNGDTSVISHIGKVKLKNGLDLKGVPVVPSFKFSLLFVPKLTEDSQCVVSFYPKFYVVQDLTTRKVKGLGKLKAGLYHLVNVPTD